MPGVARRPGTQAAVVCPPNYRATIQTTPNVAAKRVNYRDAYLSERGKSRMALPAAGLYSRYRHLIPELLKFGVVGGIGAVIDLGGAAVLHGKFHVEALEAKAISTIIATVLTYLGSRFWTFKHRENQALGRELALFIVLNVIGLVIAEAVIAIVTYGLGLHSQLEYNAASVVGTGLATIFRYFAYRQWVFTAPAEESCPRADGSRGGAGPRLPAVGPRPRVRRGGRNHRERCHLVGAVG